MELYFVVEWMTNSVAFGYEEGDRYKNAVSYGVEEKKKRTRLISG